MGYFSNLIQSEPFAQPAVLHCATRPATAFGAMEAHGAGKWSISCKPEPAMRNSEVARLQSLQSLRAEDVRVLLQVTAVFSFRLRTGFTG